MAYYAVKKYVGDGATTNFSIPFPYITSSHVEVYLAGVLQTTGYTISGATAIFTVAPANGVAIELRRNSSRSTELVTYQDAANLPASVLNQDAQQDFFMAQEAMDRAEDALYLTSGNKWDLKGYPMQNVAAPTAGTDAANKDYVDAATLAPLPTPLSVANGGTGAPDVATARSNLGVYSTSQVDTAVAAVWTTGDVKVTLKTAADAGWVMMNDGTIGDASSGATARANADTQALFTLLWNATADADCPVSTGRGASAAADWAAHKTIALPKVLGRALAVAGAGSGLTARALAHALGSEDAVVVQHNHTINDPQHAHAYGTFTAVAGQGGSGGGADLATSGTTSPAATGITINNAGVSGVGANMQPTTFLNIMVKL